MDDKYFWVILFGCLLLIVFQFVIISIMYNDNLKTHQLSIEIQDLNKRIINFNGILIDRFDECCVNVSESCIAKYDGLIIDGLDSGEI